MSEKVFWYFVKIFEKEEYADQFISGKLYLNRLSYFKRVEKNDDDGRPDRNEAVAMWWQPHDIVMTFNVPEVGEINITGQDLASPVSLSFVYHDYFHILCLYAVTTVNPESLDQLASLAEKEAELKKQFHIDERCLKFGRFAVIVKAVPFKAQLKEALERNGRLFKGALVEYYDDETFHGQIEQNKIPFRKQKRFSYQQEFRVLVWTNTEGDDPITIDMGDISHICAKCDSAQLNELFKKAQLSLSYSVPDVGADIESS